jgi:tRNA threonylcarbamoyladenosine biosynthesis protein TsaB
MHGSLALVQFEQPRPKTLEVVALEGGTFSAQLVPQISAALQRHHLAKSHIEGLAVVSGPGSFTGLRVGLAAIKALAEVLNKPITAISLLEAIAVISGNEGTVIVTIDAGRGQVYAAHCEVTHSRVAVRDQQLLRLTELVDYAGNQKIVTPDFTIVEFARAKQLAVSEVSQPRADVIARIGFDKINRGDTVSAIDLDANYIRPSDAEIKKLTNP